jgi:hypothetical protein
MNRQKFTPKHITAKLLNFNNSDVLKAQREKQRLQHGEMVLVTAGFTSETGGPQNSAIFPKTERKEAKIPLLVKMPFAKEEENKPFSNREK